MLVTALMVVGLPASAARASAPVDRANQPVGAGTPAAEMVPGELLVRFKPGVLPEHMGASLQVAGAIALDNMAGVHLVRVAGDQQAALARLSSDPRVAYVEPNRMRHIVGTPNDPLFPQQWALQNIHATDGWSAMTAANAAPVIVGMVDTGVDNTHEDLAGRVLPGFNAIDGSNNTKDGHGHGTHTAGTVAASTDNGKGIAGVVGATANIQILPVKVLSDQGSGSDFSVARGIRWAADHGAAIIRMNLTKSPI